MSHHEIKTIREAGGKIILVKRGQDPDWFTSYVEGNIAPTGIHSSEYAWAKSDFDYIIKNDGTLEDLYKQVDDLIISNKIANTPTETSDPLQPLAIGANSF